MASQWLPRVVWEREFSPSERVGATYAVEIEGVVKEPDSEVAARGGSRGMLNEV